MWLCTTWLAVECGAFFGRRFITDGRTGQRLAFPVPAQAVIVHDALSESIGTVVTVVQCEVFYRSAFQVHADGVRFAHAVLGHKKFDIRRFICR
jgi:hypothetical protein